MSANGNGINYPTKDDVDEFARSGSSTFIVTPQLLKAALTVSLGRKGVEEKELNGLTDYITSMFGYGTDLIDNVLGAADRDVFYMLEEEGILRTERDEIGLLRGKTWRIHYWLYNKQGITALLNEFISPKKKEEDLAQFYSSDVPEEAWMRG